MSKDYTNYSIEHCENVRKAYDWLVDHKIIKNEFLMHIVHHDLSKWQDEEYKAYDKYFYGKEKTTDVKDAFNYAWLHHIHNNPHHWQHWVLINDDPKEGEIVLDMPYNYIIEMVCDWWAFSWNKENLNEIFTWYDEHKSYMKLSDKTRSTVENILNKMKERLETET